MIRPVPLVIHPSVLVWNKPHSSSETSFIVWNKPYSSSETNLIHHCNLAAPLLIDSSSKINLIHHLQQPCGVASQAPLSQPVPLPIDFSSIIQNHTSYINIHHHPSSIIIHHHTSSIIIHHRSSIITHHPSSYIIHHPSSHIIKRKKAKH